jgi:hypothetical protein
MAYFSNSKKFGLLIFALLFFSHIALASENAGAFMERLPSARATGLGSNFVATSKDSSSIFWNPAGLSNIVSREIQVMTKLAFETHYKSIQICSPIDETLFIGIGYISADTPGIMEVTAKDANSERWIDTGNTFSYLGQALYLSAAKNILDSLSLGVSLKIVQENLYNNQAQGFGLDYGMRFALNSNIQLGLNYQNILTPQMRWNTASENIDIIPSNIKAGIAINLLDNKLLICSDFNFRQNRPTKFGLGSELTICEFLPIRCGFESDSENINSIIEDIANLKNFAIGISLIIDPIFIDFSWRNPDLEEIEDIYELSFGYKF